MSGRESVLVVEEVVKRFGDVTALDHVSLQVAPGEFVALLGPERRRQDHAVPVAERPVRRR